MVIRNCLFVIGSVMYVIICLLSSHFSLIPFSFYFLPSPLTCTNSYVRNYKPFLTNKANFPDAQMNASRVLSKEYEKKTLGQRGKNEPKTNPIRTQTNPIKANSQNAKINVNLLSTKIYENMSNWAIYKNEPNSKPISKAKSAAAHDTGNSHRKIFKKN